MTDQPCPPLQMQQEMFRGEGEVVAAMRAFDWAATGLGGIAQWPRSLQSIVRMMVTSRYQMWMGWGLDLIFMCNDAYRPTLGVKFPWAIGQPARKVWSEIWPEIGPLIDHVLKTGEATYSEAMLLLLERSGFREETYHTFSYSPLFDDTGAIAGMFCVVVEETVRVINDRRLDTLRRLAAAATAARGEAALFDAVGTVLATNQADLPFVMLYLFDAVAADEAPVARLVASAGIAAGHPAAPPVLAVLAAGDEVWPVRALLDAPGPTIVEDMAGRFDTLPRGVWEWPPTQALLMPIMQQARTRQVAGFLVVGLNPCRPVDAAYTGFVSLLAGQIEAALATARAYEAERRRADALAELDRAKTAFFSNVSHEFRTPLTLMLGPLQDVIESDPGSLLAEGEAPLRDQLDLVHRNGRRLLRLVNNLLDFSRLEAGRAQARFVPTDLAAFSAEIAASFRAAIERAGLDLRVACAPLPQPVFLDRGMWEKILFNLLSNAFKFTFRGSIEVEVVPGPDGLGAVVRVSDSGIGVPPDELPRLFERFHQVSGAQGRSIEGSGIGLALVQELVRLHGGTIAAASTPDVGTVFTVGLAYGTTHLPADQVDDGDAPALPRDAAMFVAEALRWLPAERAATIDAVPEAAPEAVPEAGLGAAIGMAAGEAAGAAQRHDRILLADDNADMRDFMGRLLESHGYRVTAVADGAIALRVLRETLPDLVLTDVMMPRLDGFGLLRAIRDDPALASVPVILLSARAGEEAKVEGLSAGADDYLTKPFASRELLARVMANIAMARVRREAAREAMRAEQTLLLARERLDLALSTGLIAIFEIDVGRGHICVFGRLATSFGVTEAAAAAGLPREVMAAGIAPEDRARTSALVAATLETGVPLEMEYRLIGGSAPKQVLVRGAREIDPAGGMRLIGAIVDVTEEKAAQEALRAQSRALERLNRTLEERVETAVAERLRVEEALRQAQKMEAVGQLTGGVAHDFNNLLTVIIGGLDTIRRRGVLDDPRVGRALDLAMQGANRAATLTARLLAFSRRQPLDPKPLDLNHVVRDSTALLHRTLGEPIELEAVLAARLWPAELDQNQLENAILNLAVNARDAMPDGGKLTIETANAMLDQSYAATDTEVIPGQYVVLAISDTGAGMDNATLGRVFEPFYTTKEVGKGTGLGLSMVYGFVKQSGGHITIYSEPGQGTTVRLYFPRFQGAMPASATAIDAAPPGGLREEIVLVVEDNDDVRSYSVMMLNELGYGVLEAADAEAAMVILQSPARIDLLFTDVVLPGKTGRVLATEALAIRPALRVLFTTGYSRNAIVHHGRLDAGVHLLTKPFTFDQLASRVRDVLDREG